MIHLKHFCYIKILLQLSFANFSYLYVLLVVQLFSYLSVRLAGPLGHDHVSSSSLGHPATRHPASPCTHVARRRGGPSLARKPRDDVDACGEASARRHQEKARGHESARRDDKETAGDQRGGHWGLKAAGLGLALSLAVSLVSWVELWKG